MGGVVARGPVRHVLQYSSQSLQISTYTHSGKWERREEEEPDTD